LLLTGNLSTSKDTRWDHTQGFLKSYSSEKRRRHDVFRCLGTSRQTGTPHFAHPWALSALTWSGAGAEIELFGLDPLHFVSASYAIELISLGKDVRRATYLEPELLGAAWFVCILPCSIISTSVLNLAPQVLHLYFFPNNPISNYHLPREHM